MMTLLQRLIVAAAVAAVFQTAAAAQAPPPAAPPAQPPAVGTPPAPPAAPTPPANYTYSVDGRRDPFVALIGRGGVQRGSTRPEVHAEGLAGLTAEELVVRGILQSRGAWVAMVSGPSGKVYNVRPGDRLADGTIRAVTAESVVILQQVNDPLSLEKQREVRKFLRGGENK
ncbi:MAG TPA: pilus assembly protein PilP [Vicinamibacterales bacterium]|nr:pilus assembly protein PilP [Vicinamibacterales bacterium]